MRRQPDLWALLLLAAGLITCGGGTLAAIAAVAWQMLRR